MSRRRRAFLLLGLAVVLGALAAGDMRRREQALEALVGPTVAVVVARRPLVAGEAIRSAQLTVRLVPQRYAPAARVAEPGDLVGLRPRVSLVAGADVSRAAVDSGFGPRLRPGERVASIVATGEVEAIQPGSRVDLLVTREQDGKGGSTRLALEDVEVVESGPAPSPESTEAPAGRVALSLRVTVRQAVYLAAAQNFASELRVLPRGPGDDRRGATGIAAAATLDGLR